MFDNLEEARHKNGKKGLGVGCPEAVNTSLLRGNLSFFEKWLIPGPGQGHIPLSLEHLTVSGNKDVLKD